MAKEYRCYPFESNPVPGIKEHGKGLPKGLWGRISRDREEDCVQTAASPVQRSERGFAGSDRDPPGFAEG